MFMGLLIAAFAARDQQAPETHRAGDQPEPHRQNFAVGEIPLVVTLPWSVGWAQFASLV